jgi:hypothetical protein
VVLRGDPRHKYAGEFGESHRDRRDGAGLDHQEERPTVQETAKRPERLAQIDVLAARLRHGRRQFAVAERGDKVSTAVATQVISSNPGEFTCRAISADTIKMPEPIIDPTTSVVESSSPRPLIRPCLYFVASRCHSSIRSRKDTLVRSGGSRSPITAIESAPAAHIAGAVSLVMPPIATSGFSTSARHSFKASIPVTGSGFRLDAVGEYRTECHVVYRLAARRANLLQVVAGESNNRGRTQQPARIPRRQIVLPDMQAGIQQHRDIGPVIHDEQGARLPAHPAISRAAIEHRAPPVLFVPQLQDPRASFQERRRRALQRKARASNVSVSRIG